MCVCLCVSVTVYVCVYVCACAYVQANVETQSMALRSQACIVIYRLQVLVVKTHPQSFCCILRMASTVNS